MTDPFRLRVHKRIAEVLQEITPTNGYDHDFSQCVFRGRLYFGDQDPVPMISILEAPLPIDRRPAPLSSPVTEGPWDIIIQGFVKDDRQNPTDPAHLAMADVKKRLGIEAKRKFPLGHERQGLNPLGMREGANSVEALMIGPGVVRPPEDGVSNKAYFWLTLTLKIVEDNTDPFS